MLTATWPIEPTPLIGAEPTPPQLAKANMRLSATAAQTSRALFNMGDSKVPEPVRQRTEMMMVLFVMALFGMVRFDLLLPCRGVLQLLSGWLQGKSRPELILHPLHDRVSRDRAGKLLGGVESYNPGASRSGRFNSCLRNFY